MRLLGGQATALDDQQGRSLGGLVVDECKSEAGADRVPAGASDSSEAGACTGAYGAAATTTEAELSDGDARRPQAGRGQRRAAESAQPAGAGPGLRAVEFSASVVPV